jgi:hypothetical protein
MYQGTIWPPPLLGCSLGTDMRRDLQRDRTGHRERPRQGHHRVGNPGQPSQLRVITEAQLRAGLSQAGLPPFVVDAVVEIKTRFVQGSFDILTTDIERLAGRAPQTRIEKGWR